MHLEIVTHCWRYHRLLTYQLSSLWLTPPERTRVTITVFYCELDSPTKKVLDYFQTLLLPNNVCLRGWELDQGNLLRRGIGRNLAALSTQADWVWFADCDYLFGQGAIDALGREEDSVKDSLVFPKVVQTHRQHSFGDKAIEFAAGEPRLMTICPEEFEPTQYTRAIGGVQIARGNIVRELGYCREATWQRQPTDVWLRTREDVQFRRMLNTRGTPVELPNIYRIRHSKQGRDDPTVQL